MVGRSSFLGVRARIVLLQTLRYCVEGRPSHLIFRESPKGEVRRIPIPRTPVNKPQLINLDQQVVQYVSCQELSKQAPSTCTTQRPLREEVANDCSHTPHADVEEGSLTATNTSRVADGRAPNRGG